MTPPSNFTVYLTRSTAPLAGLFFGFGIGVISGALDFIQPYFHSSDQQLELIVTALIWGALFGTFLGGFSSNKLGRKKTLLFSTLLFIVGSFQCAIAPSVNSLIFARFIFGLAVGMTVFTTPLYISEIAPEKIRGSMISAYQLLMAIGILIVFFSNTFFASHCFLFKTITEQWRLMLGIVALPALLIFIPIALLPESPRWLFLKGFQEQGMAIFKKIGLSEDEISQELHDTKDTPEKKTSSLQLLLTNSNFRRAVFLGVSLQLIQQFTGINIVMYYAPRIFKIAGFATISQQLWGTVTVGAVNVIAAIIAIIFVDKAGRKPIMYLGLTIIGASLLTIGFLFNSNLEQIPQLGLYASIALLFFILGFGMSAGPLIWVLCSEIFPLQGRDLGVTLSSSTNWICNAIVGGTFLTLLDKFGNGNVFLFYGAIQILFLLFFFFFVPETKGVSLEKIENNLMSGVPLRKIGK